MATIVKREDYFDAAIEILSADDHAGLKQAPLCDRLKVTTGSFYNYFGSWAGFKTEFLRHWLDERTVQLAEMARAEVEMDRRLAVLIEFACALPHSAESAIRAWAHSDAEVRDVQVTVDVQRFQITLETIAAIRGEGPEAEKFAHMGMFILAGYQQNHPLQDVEILRWALDRAFADVIESLGRP